MLARSCASGSALHSESQSHGVRFLGVCPEMAQQVLAKNSSILDLPSSVVQLALLAAGAKPILDLQATCRLCREDWNSEDLWLALSQRLWPASTLPPVSKHDRYGNSRELVLDGNRAGGRRAWRLSNAGWTWLHNDSRRFYCGRITMIAIDETAGEVCVYVHAVSNWDDLRRASTSIMFEQPSTGAGGYLSRFAPMPMSRCVQQILTDTEDKAVLVWPIACFKPGYRYVFSYAPFGISNPLASDYPLVHLFDVPECDALADRVVEPFRRLGSVASAARRAVLRFLPDGGSRNDESDDADPHVRPGSGSDVSTAQRNLQSLQALHGLAVTANDQQFVPHDHEEDLELVGANLRTVVAALLRQPLRRGLRFPDDGSRQ